MLPEPDAWCFSVLKFECVHVVVFWRASEFAKIVLVEIDDFAGHAIVMLVNIVFFQSDFDVVPDLVFCTD